jgi:hypothetical protein
MAKIMRMEEKKLALMIKK